VVLLKGAKASTLLVGACSESGCCSRPTIGELFDAESVVAREESDSRREGSRRCAVNVDFVQPATAINLHRNGSRILDIYSAQYPHRTDRERPVVNSSRSSIRAIRDL
jgi:hypothetical protein